MQTLTITAVLLIAAVASVGANNFWWLDNNVFGSNDVNNVNIRNNQGYQDDSGSQEVVPVATNDDTPTNSCGSSGNSNCKTEETPKNGVKSKSEGTLGLPITQGLVQNQQRAESMSSSCPDITGLPPMSDCGTMRSQCWSPGQTDWDCPDNGLCCFNGCVNICMGSTPAPSAPSASAGASQTSSQPRPRPEKQEEKPVQQSSSNDQRNEPSQGKNPPQQSISKQSPPRRPAPSNVNSLSQESRSPANNGVKPYVKCPSAMECIQRRNCDFDGFITEDPLDISPDLEMLRVPLIPCINRARGNQIDVCCRDPNYKDPWPNNNANSNNRDSQQQQGRDLNQSEIQQPQNNNINRPNKAPKRRKNGYGK